jgi:hypothetical protein
MKKAILSFLFIAICCFAYANNLSKQLFNKVTISKTSSHLSLKKQNKLKIKKKPFFCSLQGTAWASTFELECADGSTSTYVVSGIAWELYCPEYGHFYTTFCTDVESSPSGDGC